MLETMNDYISIISLLVIILVTVGTFISMNAKMRNQEESDEYYRDLL